MALALAAAAAVAADPGPGHLTLTPALLEIGPDQPWADVSIRNDGPDALVLRSAAYAWAQDRDATMYLAGAQDLTAFPATLTLGPGESRRVRLSALSPPSRTERAYRLALDLSTPPGDTDLRVLVPVFVAPIEAIVRAELGVECDCERTCRVALVNHGTVRIRPERLAVSVRSGSGAEREQELEPSWVLAGGRRVHRIDVPELERGAEVAVQAVVTGHLLRAEAAPPAEATPAWSGDP